MSDLTAFKKVPRKEEGSLSTEERVHHYKEFMVPLPSSELEKQASRCMDCGIPFCHSGCPLGNLIPDFNTAVSEKEWKKALSILHSTNNFPEFTGRLCPAPCEDACVLGIITPPVTIENLEKNIVEIGFQKGWIQAQPPSLRTGKKIAVVGSGPSGLAAAQQLNRAGHTVVVFERDDAVGGLLRYGIPDFKLEKEIIERRVAILKQEGIIFKLNTEVGKNYSIKKLKEFDAVLLCGGSTQRRKLNIDSEKVKGVVQAMDFLTQQNKRVLKVPIEEPIWAKGKDVIVIGGGDTGSDCIGTSNRQGAKSVTNFEIMPQPPQHRDVSTPWPFWALKMRTSSSHEEGCDRNWLIHTQEFVSDKKGNLIGIKTIGVEWEYGKDKRFSLKEIPHSEKFWPCQLAVLALGFSAPQTYLSDLLGIKRDERENYKASNYQTNIPHIFTAGDMRRGQSLIVWAISEGREAARSVDIFLMGKTSLPTKGEQDLPLCKDD